PVYRHPTKKRANVYAYRTEIDAWWAETQGKLTDKANGNEATAAVAAEAPAVPLGGRRLWVTVVAVLAVSLAAGAVFWASRRVAVEGPDGIRQELLGTLRMGYGVVSPDGKRLIYEDSETAHLRVRSLETGEDRVVVPEWSMGRYVWSPDSRKVAYIAFQRPRRLEVVDIDTGERQVLQKQPDEPYLFRPHAWAADGKRILGRTIVPNEDVQVAFLNLTDGGLEPVAAPVKDAQMLGISPDGRFIRYQSVRNGNSDIYLWPLDGNGEETR
ncbi:MAG: hypothetical protein GY953_28605, partial [bacterium]|nr:hypothetical protein [bacterium]